MVQCIIHKRTWEGQVEVRGEVAGRFATGSVLSESLSSDCSSLITMGLATSVPSESLNIPIGAKK